MHATYSRVVSEYDVGFLGMGHLFERYEREFRLLVYIIGLRVVPYKLRFIHTS